MVAISADLDPEGLFHKYDHVHRADRVEKARVEQVDVQTELRIVLRVAQLADVFFQFCSDFFHFQFSSNHFVSDTRSILSFALCGSFSMQTMRPGIM